MEHQLPPVQWAALARGLRDVAAALGLALEPHRSPATVIRPDEAGKPAALDHRLPSRACRRTSTPPLLTVRLLGGFEVYRGAERVPPTAWRRRRARLLFCYLLLARGPVPRDVVLEALWPDLSPQSARASLNVAWSNAKRALGAGAGAAAGYFLLERGRYGLRRELVVTDVEEFERHLAAADRAQEPERALAALEAATSTYRGDLLPEAASEPWTVIERERLHELYVGAMERLADVKAARGRLAEAGAHLREILRIDPWREEIYRRLMAVLAEGGRRSEALRLYRQCAAILRRELGVEPGPETQALFEVVAAGGFPRPRGS